MKKYVPRKKKMELGGEPITDDAKTQALIGGGTAIAGYAGNLLQQQNENGGAGYIAGSALKGAASGAGIGMAAGPMGALIGGGVGLLAGGISGAIESSKKKAAEEQLTALRTQMKERSDRQRLINYREGIGQQNSFYAKGGLLDPQYEAEGGEIIQGAGIQTGGEGSLTPLASGTAKINGPSHESGGVDMSGGERIFSDRLKPQGSNRTFAQHAESIAKKKGKMESKLSSHNDITKNTGERMMQRLEQSLDGLFAMQEGQKATTGSRKMAYGGKLKKYDEGGKPLDPKRYEAAYAEAAAPDIFTMPGGNGLYPGMEKSDPEFTSATTSTQTTPGTTKNALTWDKIDYAQLAPSAIGLAQSLAPSTYAPRIKNESRDLAITNLEGMKDTFSTRDIERKLSTEYRSAVDGVNRSIGSAPVAASNRQMLFAKRLGAVSDIHTQRQNIETQLKNTKRSALAEAHARFGSEDAGFKSAYDQNVLATDANKRMLTNTYAGDIANKIGQINRDKKLMQSDYDKIAILSRQWESSGVGGRFEDWFYGQDASLYKRVYGKDKPETIK